MSVERLYMPGAGSRRCVYLMTPHQTAKAAVAKTAVMAVEISNERAPNLIQSVTAHDFQSGSITASEV